jgi:hypothetical protein
MTPLPDFRFYPESPRCRALAGGWLKLAVATLLIAGVYALLLAVARTPFIKDIVPSDDFFHVSLVIHVIFSNVFWFLAMAGALWSMNTNDRFIPLGWTALGVASIGVVVIAISPFTGAGAPVMSNYIPYLNDSTFFAGLSIAGCGFLLLVLRTLITVPKLRVTTPSGSMRFGVYISTNAAAMAIIAFFWAFFTMPQIEPSGQIYYQGLFWLGGHVLQFTHALLMLVAWIWLASASGVRFRISPRITSLMFTLALITVAFTPIAFLSLDVHSVSFQHWFTTHMRIGGAAATVPLGLAVLWSLFAANKANAEQQPLRTALWLSILLFALGGLLGYWLHESSTLVTAHYHSVTGAVTLAFMALVYAILPHLGFGSIAPRLAKIQVFFYGIGQLLHVLGLAWAGGYGMARKVGGSGESLDNIGQTMGMALMGLGGFIATIGGILFLFIVIRSMRKPS